MYKLDECFMFNKGTVWRGITDIRIVMVAVDNEFEIFQKAPGSFIGMKPVESNILCITLATYIIP